MDNFPIISILMTNKNGGEFLRHTLNSIFAQSYSNFEICLTDGGSIDNSIEIYKEYSGDKRFRYQISADNDPHEGWTKALSMARGKYIMICCVSDGYVDRYWIENCAHVLNDDQNVSLVYGMTKLIDGEGKTNKSVDFPRWFIKPPPNKQDFFSYWLGTYSYIGELTYCIRANVFKECFPSYSSKNISNYNINDYNQLTDNLFLTNSPFSLFLFNIISKGYLPFFIPSVAAFGRQNEDARSVRFAKYLKMDSKKFRDYVDKYKQNIFKGVKVHSFRNGNREVIGTLKDKDIFLLKIMILKHRVFGLVQYGKKDFLNIHQNKIRIKKLIGTLNKAFLY